MVRPVRVGDQAWDESIDEFLDHCRCVLFGEHAFEEIAAIICDLFWVSAKRRRFPSTFPYSKR